MRIIRNREVVDDDWVHVADEDELPAGHAYIVPLARLDRDADAVLGRGLRLGVRVTGDVEPERLVSWLGRLQLIAIEFPKFTDGRGYTLARLLRERFGFGGELRAIGQVLHDQLFYMERCGFDAFELAPGKSPERALEAFGEISVVYQSAADGRQPRWRRGRKSPGVEEVER